MAMTKTANSNAPRNVIINNDGFHDLLHAVSGKMTFLYGHEVMQHQAKGTPIFRYVYFDELPECNIYETPWTKEAVRSYIRHLLTYQPSDR